MENSFQTSFIPKKPVLSSSNGHKLPRSLFLVLSIFILIITILASVGLFLYKNNLEKQRDSLSISLAEIRDSFEKDTVDELLLFDRRIELSKKILDNHIIFSPLFNLLGELTIPSIQYTSFKNVDTKNNVTIEIKGIARDYRSIALQAGIFNSPQASDLSNVLFYNLVKDKNNNVSFDLKFNIKPGFFSYKNNTTTQ
jgi:hypothetical protein